MATIKKTLLLLLLIVVQLVSCSKNNITEDDETTKEPGLTLVDQVSLRGTGDEFGLGIVATANGFIICGVAADEKPYVIAIDNNHNVLWEKILGTSGVGGFEKIIQTNDGNFIATGFVETTFREFDLDIYAVKLNATGEILWEKTFGFNYITDTTMDMIETSNGDIVIGATKLSEPLPSDILVSDNEVLVLKINTQGEMIWSETYEATDGNNTFTSLIDEPNGNILIGGSFTYEESRPGSSITILKSNLLIFRINPIGEVVQEKIFETAENDGAAKLHKLNNGQILVLSGKSGGNQNDRDVLLFTLTNTLEIDRQVFIGGEGLDFAVSLIENEANELFLVGDTNSHLITSDTDFASSDLWVVKISPSFTVLDELVLGGSNSEAASEVIIKDDKLVIVGSTGSNDGDVLVNNGAWDIWVTFIEDIE